ncbi:MAG TPA: hypothetical protein PKW15_05575 [Alphaproteobacteria bacterium]|nr:hypothetical protein [Rhodospirillaceae bacterium]HRJ12696.1 hypothetical protein [Alphaproteobacteria bacterium]
MANLIITIISIALVAVAALMGAYYGGTAFLEGQAKSRATTILSQAEQIAAAWRLWSVDRGGTIYLTDKNWSAASGGGTSDDLVPNYLSDLPKTSWLTQVSSYGFWLPAKWQALSISGGQSLVDDNNALFLGATTADYAQALSICRKFIQIVSGTEADPVNRTTTPWRQPADCVFIDGNANGTLDSNDFITFVYKVH